MDATSKTGDSLSDFRASPRMFTLSVLAGVIGVLAAGAAWVLRWLISVITNLAFHFRWSAAEATPLGNHLGPAVVLVPVIGALIIGLMARYGSPKIRGHGIPEALEAILIGRSRIEPKVAILKPLSSAISIGTGGPFGAEGPIIVTGGALGSLVAQLFHLTAAERKTLLAAGAAGGMAAIFGTPVAAVLLAVELLLFEWKPRSFIPVAIAASVAAMVRVPLLGSGPMFPTTAHAQLNATILGAAAVVGILTGFCSGLVTTMVYAVEDCFHKIPVHWMWWPAIGAVAVGVGGWIDPRVLGVGYDLIRAMLEGKLVGAALAGLLIGKALVWAIALGSGTSGGVLAPLLIIGGAWGALLGHWIPAGDTGLWAMMGMAAMMAGSMRAPFAATVFVLELTHDLNALPALLIACIASVAVTILLMRRSILTEKLARRGRHVSYEYSVDLFEILRVGEVMEKNPPAVPVGITSGELADLFLQGGSRLSGRQATLLMNEQDQLTGIVTRGDLLRSLQEDPSGKTPALEAGSARPIVAFPDEVLYEAVERMIRNNIGRLPVVDRNEPRRVLGYLGRTSVMLARSRHLEEEQLREKASLGDLLSIGPQARQESNHE